MVVRLDLGAGSAGYVEEQVNNLVGRPIRDVIRLNIAATVRRRQGIKEMSYKKPQIVAKSAAKQSYVAGCPSRTGHSCHGNCRECEISGK